MEKDRIAEIGATYMLLMATVMALEIPPTKDTVVALQAMALDVEDFINGKGFAGTPLKDRLIGIDASLKEEVEAAEAEAESVKATYTSLSTYEGPMMSLKDAFFVNGASTKQ